MKTALMLLSLAVAALGAGCGDDPVDASGTWHVNVTNRDNGCGFQNWTEGGTGQTDFVITQDGSNVTGTVSGFVGLLVSLWLGTNEFNGNVDGANMHLVLHGTNATTTGTCTYTINAEISGAINGDTINGGRIDYRPATNGSPDCGVLQSCTTWQEFSGARAPQ